MSKIIYLDTETTGLDKEKNDVIQVAGIIEIDGKEVERFNIFCQPFSFENISQEALDVTGRTVEELQGFQDPRKAYKEFIAIIGKYVNKFDKPDKFYLAGQNVKFDLEFLHGWAKKNGDIYLGSYFWWYVIDLYVFTAAARAWGYLGFETLKLSDVCRGLNIKLEDAHDAMADIEATRECLKYFQKTYDPIPF